MERLVTPRILFRLLFHHCQCHPGTTAKTKPEFSAAGVARFFQLLLPIYITFISQSGEVADRMTS
jgi:hypothetical protein